MEAVCIMSGSHLCHNPRVLKEATALAEAGFDVEIFGAWFDPVLKARDEAMHPNLPFRFTPVLDLACDPIRRIACRVRTRLGRSVFRRLGIQNQSQLGYAPSALYQAVRRSPASLFIAHSEQALGALSRLRASRARVSTSFRFSSSCPLDLRVAVDMEDWFSEDLMPDVRLERPVKMLRGFEQELLCNGAHRTCTSKAMSDALAAEFGCPPPTVIYNAFPWADRETLDGQFKDRKDPSILSVHWYSQTIGPGRGLEELFASLPLLTRPCEVHLRGKPVAGFESWISGQVPAAWRSRVFVHALVSNEELLSRIAEHDIGFAGEQKFCRSRDLTVTNKILHYLLGGLAVVASDTAGQREIGAQAGDAVQLYPVGDAGALAQRLNRWLENPEHLADAKAAALRVAEQRFSWERQAPVLLRSVESALGAQPVMASRS